MLHNIHSCKWCWVVKKGNRIRRLMSIMSNRFFLEQVRVSKWHKCIYFPQAICTLCEPLLCCCFACYFSCSNKDKKVLARAKGLIHLVSDEGFGASCQLEIQLLLFEEEIISVTSILVICSGVYYTLGYIPHFSNVQLLAEFKLTHLLNKIQFNIVSRVLSLWNTKFKLV